MSDGSDALRQKTLCSGWLEHKTQKSGDKYRKLWALLEGNVIFIFKTNQPSSDTQIGNLTLDSTAEFISKPGGNPSKGYKFELHTSNKVNTFKTKKSTGRELWRGYIMGIAKKWVPSNLDLLEQDLQQIHDDISEYHGIKTNQQSSHRHSLHSGRSVESMQDSGVVSLMGSFGGDVASGVTSRSSSSSASDTLSGGGPTQVHMFYNDRNRNQPPPSWFFPHCSRETAEKILERANTLEYGNTLMRESTSFLQNGSYVISKIFIHSNGSISYDHYEVIRTAGGYKVNVQNPHSPMKCLQDVMDYFITTSESGTKPLVTNDLTALGQDVPGYATEIYNRRKSSDTRWSLGGEYSSEEPAPGYANYDDADFGNEVVTNNASKHIDGSNTVSPGILRRDSRPSAPGQRKSVGWNSVVNTPPPIPQHHTYAPGSKQNRPVAPSVDEFRQRQREADELNDFDKMITSFESSTLYYNSPAALGLNDRARSSSLTGVPPPPPAPPLPAPHNMNSPSYVNQEPDPDPLAQLPVAPPPPRAPIVQSQTSSHAQSRPSSTSSVSPALRFVSPQATKPPPSSVPQRHSVSTIDMSSRQQASPNIAKSPSEGQLKKPVTSPNSPQAFPVWNNAAKKSDNVNNNVPNRNSSVDIINEHPNEEAKEGVDEQNPGGVSTLRARFNQMATASTSTPAVKKDEPKVTYKTYNTSSASVNETPVIKDSLKQRPKTELRGFHKSKGPTNTEQYDDDVTYDDTGVPVDPMTAEGRRPFVRQSTEPSSVHNTQANSPAVPIQSPPAPAPKPAGGDRLTQRRQTEPAVSVSRVQFEVPSSHDDMATGLNEDFKKKLGALFGGAQQGSQPQGAGRGVPKTPTSPHARQFPRTDTEDHLYQELPEIEPDGVTYVNERFNTETQDNT